MEFALAVIAVGGAGCFDVHNVDSNVLLIDDFDDGNALPADPQFGLWQCYSYNPHNQSYSCGLEAGYDSPNSMALKFDIVDPPDGIQQYGGVSLVAQAMAPQDLSRFGEIVFTAKLTSGNPPLPSAAGLYVELFCESALADDGSNPGNLEVAQSVAYQSDWRTFLVSFASFTTPQWLSTHIKGGPAACLQQVNNIRFEVALNLPDGQAGSGQLNVDDIYFQ